MLREPTPAPNAIIWRITDRCDLDCAHCGLHGPLSDPEVMNLEAMLKIADMIIEAECESVVLAGGEPLVRDDWKEIAKHLLDGKVRVSLVSNGTRFDDELVEWCLEHEIGAVHFSLDGGKELHDAQRRSSGSYEQTVQAIERALDAGLYVAVITVLTRTVVSDLETLYQALKDIGVDQWQVRLATHHDANALEDGDYISPEEVGDIFERSLALANSIGGPDVYASTSLGYYGDVEKTLRGGKKVDSWRGCSCGIDWCTIEPNGDVRACGNGAPVEGNLGEHSLLDIWTRDGAFSHSRAVTLAELGGKCRECEWARLCNGGCLAIARTDDEGRESRHCLQHPATGGPRNRPGFVERNRVKKLRKDL